MSYYLVVGGERWTQVASVSGWKEFRDHVEGLEGHEQLRHLVLYGWSQKLTELSEQLSDAMSDGASENVRSIGNAILTALADAPDNAESCLLTDGMTSKEDPDENGWDGDEEETETEESLMSE